MYKKMILTVALATALGLSGWHYAQAAGPHGQGPCWQQGAAGNLDEAGRKKLEQFMAETKELRKAMVVKRAEKLALLRAEKPDAARIAALAGDLFELRNQLHVKAVEAGVGPGMMMHMAGFGPGADGPCDGHGQRHGMGRGPGHGMGCWN